jgi:hypothetical protein
MIRGTPSPLGPSKHWDNAYIFQYENIGKYSVYKIKDGASTTLQPWTVSYINTTGWNTMRVIAFGSSLKFYLNGNLVWAGSDTSLKSGKVGFGMFRDSSASNYMVVDWAVLTTDVIAAAADLNEPLVETGQEYPDWTDMDRSPH